MFAADGRESECRAQAAVAERSKAIRVSCEIMPLLGGHELLVRLGERIVLDQAGEMFELLRAEEDPQVRRRRLETGDGGAIRLGQVTRQLIDGPLDLPQIACRRQFDPLPPVRPPIPE